MRKYDFFGRAICVCMGVIITSSSFAQDTDKAYPGPVFYDMGPVYDVNDADFVPDKNQILKAIFDIERLQEDPSVPNPLITSLNRYFNMHVRKGIPEKNIHLAFVVHGSSSKDILSHEAYHKRYGVDNPNLSFIKALNEKGVDMFICGQSANYAGISKNEITSEVKLALSAMSVLTTFQMDGYSMIRF